jgi:hypothetical protein
MKIPETEYSLLSSGWFAANHACVSIFVPTHTTNMDIFDPYETGEAAELSLELLDVYGHGNLTSVFGAVETVFFSETEYYELLVLDMNLHQDVCARFLTVVDMAMQHQAWLTQQLWLEIADTTVFENTAVLDMVSDMWDTSYKNSLEKMKNATLLLYNNSYLQLGERVLEIMLNITESRLNAASILGVNTTSCNELYQNCLDEIEEGEITYVVDSLVEIFSTIDQLLNGEEGDFTLISSKKNEEYPVIFFLLALIAGMIVVVFVVVFYNLRNTD